MRIVNVSIGILSLILGFIGIFLPLLPTTPFILLSAYCFAKSSPRLYQWLISNKTFGPVIREWQESRTISSAVKIRAILLIMTTFTITILFFIEQSYLQFLLLFIATVIITYIARIPSRATVLAAETDTEQ
ncbi:YbaN family protein [Kaarinaea lacus]